MEKIRIGNDIRIAVDLRQLFGKNYLRERVVYNPSDTSFENIDQNDFVNKRSELYYPNQYDTNTDFVPIKPEGNPVSIREVKAILVNTSLQQNRINDIRKKSRFISRFPIEPCISAFTATPYDICSSGYHTWRAYPHRHCMTMYHGFGLNPQWDGIYKRLPNINDTEYIADVISTKEPNKVEVIFPAQHQLHTGAYKLILVAKLYCPGFNFKNLKTVTVDVPDVFELTPSTKEGVDSDINVTVSTIEDYLPEGGYSNSGQNSDVYINSGVLDGDRMYLQRTDGNSINIDLSGLHSWYEEE